ncbi:MAG: ABC transporter substrate-binding protein [Hyphomicrobiaceae bacterium]
MRIAGSFGVQYLAFYVMEREKLVEKHAKAAGVPELKVSFPRISGGAALNDAVVSGATDFAGVGIAPFAILWNKTKGNLNVKALAALGDVPMVLLTNDPRIKSLKDLKDGDRIAVPAVKASMQAMLLQMAAGEIFGADRFDSVDKHTVTMRHSEATTALLAGKGVVNMHFSVPPYANRAKTNPAVREIMNSTQILGGPATINLLVCTEAFYKANHTLAKIVVAALTEATELIESRPSLAAEIYLEADKGGARDKKMVEEILADPNVNFTIVPHGVGKYVSFMVDRGIIKNKPASWKDMFFAEAQSLPGN